MRFILKKWKTSAVSTTDWMVETQLCKLRGTSDTFVGSAYFIIILRSIEKRLLWARPIGGWNSTLRAAYSIIRLYRAHAINRSFSPFFSAQTFAPILYVRTRTDCCLLLFLNMSSYEYYWCCWCCCAYRVVPYDPSLVVASFVASLSRSYCWAEPSNG